MSSGYLYSEQEPVIKCPYCSTFCRADFVDIGVGYTQCGPYHCETCGSSEIGPYDKEKPLTEEEIKTGWYKNDYGSSANVIHGKIVSYKQMEAQYKDEFTNNPLWYDKEYVEQWWDKIRK